MLNKDWRRRLREFTLWVSSRFDRVLVILFGSRCRGDYELYSDTDILIIIDDEVDYSSVLEEIVYKAREYSVPSPEIHLYSYRDVVSEIESGNTVLIDAFLEGELLLDSIGSYDVLREKAREYIVRKRLCRSSLGWTPCNQ